MDGSREKEGGKGRREKRKEEKEKEKEKGKEKEKREGEKRESRGGILGSDHGVGRARAAVGRYAMHGMGRRRDRTAIDFGAGSAGSPGNLEFGQEGV